MSNNPEKVFISYSWDSKEHQNWVIYLATKLRSEGYDANLDQSITATSTVNLNQMMVEHIRDDDYIIMILTEKYTTKADDFDGGVGFETILSLPIIQQNLEKLIILIRQPTVTHKSIPFHLKGINYIDFSDPEKFNDKFEELVHRLQKVPFFDLGPIGEKRIRQPEVLNNLNINVLNNVKIPKLKIPTDIEKNSFIKENFKLISSNLDEILNNVQNSNSNFIYQKENIGNNKVIYSFYLNGQNVSNLKLWLDNFYNSVKQIRLSVGRYINVSNDNSMNGYVCVEMDLENNLSLSMPMNMFSSKNKEMTYTDVVKEIYEHFILPYLK
ncbi:toll/interleukin-1 receptor domain-containing protein [Rummeliibacillus suwonensis]|uniref:toll/interleukin-1 receptor domain-containing protein n=1 Tax=Rummeliibacillus suwonensis TaxID=1306154 RepID=UPI0028967711|nr:toll/interleukin-1 receptor domain-containing protein [Rummeliibacillus suwonensis]